MNLAIHIDKNELDYQLVSLSKQNDVYDKLLYYYAEINQDIMKLKIAVDDKIERVIKLYKLLD